MSWHRRPACEAATGGAPVAPPEGHPGEGHKGGTKRPVLGAETFPPEVNGVARTLARWVEAFRSRGHAVRVVRPRQPGETPAEDRIHGMALPFYQQVRFGVAGPLKMGQLLQRLAPDLIHV